MKLNPKSTIAAAVLFTLMTPMMASAVVKTNQVSEEKIVLSYSAFELDSSAGRQYVEAKIKSAARKVCGYTGYSKDRSLSRFMDSKECYKDAVSGAMERIESRVTTTD